MTQRQLAEQHAGLDARIQALERFARSTTNLTTQSDPHLLIRQAQEVALSLLSPGYALYYEQEGTRWRNRVQVGEVGNADLQAFIDAGPLVGETPSVDVPWTTGQTLYQETYAQGSDTPADMVQHVNAAASLPVIRDGETVGVFIAVLFEQRKWTDTDRGVLETIVSSLSLALQLAEQIRQREVESRALDAFVAFTEAAGSENDATALTRQAIEVVQANISDISVAYYELEQGLWKGRVWSNEVTEEVVAQMRAGVPTDAPHFAQVAEKKTAVFADGWDAAGDQLSEASMYGAAAFLPLIHQGEARGIFAVGKLVGPTWSVRERAILRAVKRSLQLALDRADQAQQIMIQRDTLELRSLELQAANEELEAFTYSASHDLRTPVRHVMGFAELAQKALEKTPNEQVHRHLEVVKQGALRMTELIDGMLTLSRSGRQELHTQWVSLNDVASQARRDVEAEFAGHPVRWQIGALPVVQGDRGLLQQVMTNLLSNAVKYSGKRETSQVKVWTEEEETLWKISVQDNGVGFDPQYSQKLFGIFQRLHPEREFKGTGVGLATVRRIVMKHGGQVFAESPDDSGATFSFTLPRQKGA
ncbi:ATP-binding protein [Deinococcus sp. UYEF24]